jgi:hypothetical protein
MKTPLLVTLCCMALLPTADAEPLYTQKGTDPSFKEVMESGKLPKGKTSSQGFSGSKINVNNKLVELTAESRRPLSPDLWVKRA